VRVDQAGRNETAADVLYMIDLNDVINDTRDPLWQVSGRADPGDAALAGQYGGIAEYLGSGPQPADVGQQAYCHRRFTHLRTSPACHAVLA
jgi:hypothetical protein